MKTREILLAALIIAAGVFVYYAQTGRLDFGGDGDVGIFFGRGEEFTFEESREIDAPLPREIEVMNSHGSVEIEGTETDKISVSFKKTIYRRNQGEARKVAGQLKMVVNREEPRLILATNRDDFRRKNFETHFRLSVPKGMPVLIKNSYGPVKASGTGKTDIANSHGEVETSETAGPLIIDSSYEDVVVRGSQADCQITSRHADVSVGRVQGELLIEHSYGEISLEDVNQKIKIDGAHSAVTGKNLKGDIEVGTSYEPISLTDAGPAKVRSHHSDIEARRINGPLEIEDTHARLRLDDVKGKLRVQGADLEISAGGVLAEDVWISSSYDNVRILNFTGKTTVLLAHGDLTLEPESVAGPIDVEATYSNIRFLWPAGEKFPFEARAKSGSIVWGLSDPPSLEQRDHESVARAYGDETGKPAVKLSTTYGDIRVEPKSGAAKTI